MAAPHRDLMELNGDHDDSGSESHAGPEQVVGAGRVGYVVAEYEERRQRVLATTEASSSEYVVPQRPEDRPVMHGEAK